MSKNNNNYTKAFKAVDKFKKKFVSTYIAFMTMSAFAITAFAAPTNNSGANSGSSADTLWNNMIDFITPWITKLGGVVVLIGAIMWGLGFKGEDAEQQTRGARTFVAGCIVAAVGASANVFLG